MFLSPEVFINLFLDFLFFIFLAISAVIAFGIVRFWDIKSDSYRQYQLLRRSYLVSTIIRFTLFFKIIEIFYFIYTLDKLSNIIPGAMCAAGVITANSYGLPLMVIKMIDIYLFGLWIAIDRWDSQTKELLFTKLKFKFFLLIFFLIAVELVLEYLYFNGLDVSKIVSCCGVLFNPVSQSVVGKLFSIDPKIAASLFYLSFMLLLLFRRRIYLFSILSLIFLFVSLLAIILFFSPYIYELPTHRCPFCFLQKEYGYIGYVIYTFLFLGTFLGIKEGLKQFLTKKSSSSTLSLLFDTLLVVLLSYYVLGYYIKNGVWLW